MPWVQAAFALEVTDEELAQLSGPGAEQTHYWDDLAYLAALATDAASAARNGTVVLVSTIEGRIKGRHILVPESATTPGDYDDPYWNS